MFKYIINIINYIKKMYRSLEMQCIDSFISKC